MNFNVNFYNFYINICSFKNNTCNIVEPSIKVSILQLVRHIVIHQLQILNSQYSCLHITACHMYIQHVIFIVLLFSAAVETQSSNNTSPVRIDTVVIPGAPIEPRSCPSADSLESAQSNLSVAIQQSLPASEPSDPSTLSTCGEAGWRPVADLNMADPSQACPSPWTEASFQARSCVRSTSAGCDGVSFTVSGGTYSQVCGRAVGYIRSYPDAFTGSINIDSPYVDGVSVTYGSHLEFYSYK